MSASLLEVLTENERQANRSCVFAGLWTAADPEFAALVERNPAAAVREVQR